MKIIEEIEKNIKCLSKSQSKKGNTNYVTGDTNYVEKTSNYGYLKYILLIFILLIGGYVIISVIRDMNITDIINKQKLTPKTISNINANIVQNRSNTNIRPKNIVKEEGKKPIKHVQEQSKQKITIDKLNYIKRSEFDFCWYKEKSDDNSCYLF